MKYRDAYGKITKMKMERLRGRGIEPEKIEMACKHIFKYLDQEDFSLQEIDVLLSSMGNAMNIVTSNDPLRKIRDFDYPEALAIQNLL